MTSGLMTAREAGLIACVRCGLLHEKKIHECTRCGAYLESRDATSIQRVWALWLVGLICYVPANIYPMLRTQQLFTVDESTIVGGAVELIHYGSIGIAIIILVASVLIPIAKFVCIAFLALSVGRAGQEGAHQRHILYESRRLFR